MSVRIGVVDLSRARTATTTRSTRSSWPAPSRSRCGTSRPTLDGRRAVILPGGFAYGDYLRAGVIARFSPVMRAVAGVRRRGRPRPRDLQRLPGPGRGRARARGAAPQPRRCGSLGRDVAISPERLDTPFTRALDDRRPLRMPIAHGEGCYYADDATLDAARARRPGPLPLRRRRRRGRPATGRPGQSERLAAGDRRRAATRAGNVAGLMPHPERAAEAVLGSDDGLRDHPLAGRGGRPSAAAAGGPGPGRERPDDAIAPTPPPAAAASRSIAGSA